MRTILIPFNVSAPSSRAARAPGTMRVFSAMIRSSQRHKILWAVVRSNPVFVMYLFICGQSSVVSLFPNELMFWSVSLGVGAWIVWAITHYVPITNVSPSLPLRASTTTRLRTVAAKTWRWIPAKLAFGFIRFLHNQGLFSAPTFANARRRFIRTWFAIILPFVMGAMERQKTRHAIFMARVQRDFLPAAALTNHRLRWYRGLANTLHAGRNISLALIGLLPMASKVTIGYGRSATTLTSFHGTIIARQFQEVSL